jgi:hypothetical protein
MNLRQVISLVALTLLVLVVSGCGIGPTPTPTPKPTVAVTPTVPLPTETPLPPTPTPVPPTPVPPTLTPIPPQATTKQQTNVRQGPGTEFAIAGKMPVNTNAAVLGKSEDGKWFQVSFPDPAHPAWLPTTFVSVTGSIEQLPVVAVAAPVAPTAGPTSAVAAATKAPAAVPTQVFPAARGSMGFVTLDAAQNTYVLYNLVIDPRSYSASRAMGAQPFDLSRTTQAAPFAMSPVSGRVAFVFDSGNLINKLRVTHPTNPDLSLDRDLASHQGISSPAFSPDGTTIAYVGMDRSGPNDYGSQFIYTVPADGGQVQRLFPSNPTDLQNRPGEVFRGIAWGKTHLAFVSNLTGQFEIWRLNWDGSGPMQITKDKRENISPAWSPDGKSLAYASKQVDGTYQIMVVNAFDGSAARKLTSTAHNFSPVWSPDGNWIAFASNRGGRSYDIYIMDKNGGNVKQLTDKFPGQALVPNGWR